jgi:predicted permease
MRGFLQDVRHGARMLRRNPGFGAVATLSLALGVGVNLAVFSLVNSVLLRPVGGIAGPERVVKIYTSDRSDRFGASSYPDFLSIGRLKNAFSDVCLRRSGPLSVNTVRGPKIVLGAAVSRGYFDTLGVPVAQGRVFREEESVPGTPVDVVIISHRLWDESFEKDPALVGKSVRINDQPFTVIGIGRAGFGGESVGFWTDVWLPISTVRTISLVDFPIADRSARMFEIGGRVRAGVAAPQAQAALGVLSAQLAGEHPDTNRGREFTIVSGWPARFPNAEMGRGVSLLMVILSVLVGVVFLVACVNTASLLLARGEVRQGEFAMRRALGASPARLTGQMLTENLMLSLMGGVGGVLVSQWVISLFGVYRPPTPVPVCLRLDNDWRVAAYTVALCVISTVLMTAGPALRMHRSAAAELLREAQGTPRGGHARTRAMTCLVAGQIALSLAAIAVSAIFLRSLHATLRTDPGFETSDRLLVGFNLDYAHYDEARGRMFYRQLLEQIRSVSGVEAASLAMAPPLSYIRDSSEIFVEGYQARPGETLRAERNLVEEGYFETMGIPLLEGRGFDQRDASPATGTAIVNQSLANRFWPGRSALGRRFRMGNETLTVVGVARDGKYSDITENQQMCIYGSLRRVHVGYTTLIVKTAGDPAWMAGKVTDVVRRLAPELPLVEVRTMKEHLRLTRYPVVLAAMMSGTFGLLALALAVIGVYGVTAYSVGQRAHEFGVRMAMGARRADILLMVLRQGLRTTAAGIAVGLLLVAAAAGSLRGLLYQVAPGDPLALVGATLLMAVAAGASCWLAAWRVSRLDAGEVLRQV